MKELAITNKPEKTTVLKAGGILLAVVGIGVGIFKGVSKLIKK